MTWKCFRCMHCLVHFQDLSQISAVTHFLHHVFTMSRCGRVSPRVVTCHVRRWAAAAWCWLLGHSVSTDGEAVGGSLYWGRTAPPLHCHCLPGCQANLIQYSPAFCNLNLTTPASPLPRHKTQVQCCESRAVNEIWIELSHLYSEKVPIIADYTSHPLLRILNGHLNMTNDKSTWNWNACQQSKTLRGNF